MARCQETCPRERVSRDSLAQNCHKRKTVNTKAEQTPASIGLFPDGSPTTMPPSPKLLRSSLDSVYFLMCQTHLSYREALLETLRQCRQSVPNSVGTAAVSTSGS